MSVAPANTTSVLVAITGVLQDPSTYSVSGTTLTFSAAPPSGTNNISVRYLGIPASGVTTTAYRTVTNFTATAGQTSFAPPSYTVGYINVFRNGVYLPTTDYTATTGTTVVLNNAATVGDTITVESFYVSSVINAVAQTNGSSTGQTLVSPSLTSPTLTSPTMTGAVVSSMASSVLTSGTAVASTSGTSIDFTGIPSWAKRITVMFSGVSVSGTASFVLQIGSGSITSTGYASGSANIYNGGSPQTVTWTTGFILNNASAASELSSGTVVLTLITGNTWVSAGNLQETTGARTRTSGGNVSLSGVLDRLRITTSNGTDTFDAGSINILYE
jgi:hypothetical protein